VGDFSADREKTKFGEIAVLRLNIVEPDGTLRMVISDKARFPGIILHGTEHPHPNRKSAGMKGKDVDGHDRIALEVSADGSPVVRFLDQDGKLVSQLPPGR
jgi:hypothetical protein